MHSKRKSSRSARWAMAIVGMLAIAPCVPAVAQAPATGLGQAWPNAADVSVSPRFHVYVFVRDGIRYIQVNDADGTVRGAIATAAGQTLVLPIGADGSSVRVVQGGFQAAASAATETVYSDSVTRITATTQSDGTVVLSVSNDGGARCLDLATCSQGTVSH